MDGLGGELGLLADEGSDQRLMSGFEHGSWSLEVDVHYSSNIISCNMVVDTYMQITQITHREYKSISSQRAL